ARYEPAKEPELVRITVSPAEAILAARTGRASLRVTAHFADGAAADVSSLARFETLNDEVVTVDRDGLVKAQSAGDTAILVRYAGQVEATTILVPRTVPSSPALDSYTTTGFIDDQINAKLKKLNIVPSGLAEDVEFLRRASLDVIGTLPTPSAIREFLGDTRPYKRARKIDDLLPRPQYPPSLPP